MTRKLIAMALAAGSMLGALGGTYEAPDGRVWSYYVYDGTATIQGVDSASGALNIPATVLDGGASYPVTRINSSAFQNHSEISAVTIPSSVTEIGSYAFYGCTGLRSVPIPVSVRSIGYSTFRGCSSLESISIPVSVSRIEDSAFRDCTSLRTIDLPVTLTLIGYEAFYGCISLSSVKVPFSVKTISKGAFYGCSALYDLELQEGLENIDSQAFYGCSALREVVIPSTVTSISYYAFDGCGNVCSVTIPAYMANGYSNLRSVFGDSCKLISSVTLHEGCVSINYSAFDSCSGLTSVKLPTSITAIDGNAFRACTSLEEISIAAGNQNYKFSGGLLLTKNGETIVAVPSGRTWVSIPDTVTSVSPSVFYYCPNLNFNRSSGGIQSIDGWIVGYDEDELPSRLTLNGYRGIADGVFSYESRLTSVSIGEGVKTIGAAAFAECANLTSVSIPASVRKIGEDAFYQTFRLKTITLASGNKIYKYSGGLLASVDNTQLVAASRDATSVKIPEGVTVIPNGFCAGCTKLTSVTIPKSMEDIDDESFAGWEEEETDDDWIYKFHGCPALKTITVTAGNPYWKSVNGMLLGIDDDCYLKSVPQALTGVTVPEGVRWISYYAFAGCSKLTSITLPKSFEGDDLSLYGEYGDGGMDETSGPYKLTSIKVAAGNEKYSSVNGLLLSMDGTGIKCVPPGLTSVTMPANVMEVDPRDFEYCAKLKSFSVEKGSKSFSAVNGMLVTKDGTELVCVPPALKSQRTITIPTGVTRIGNYAFSGFDKLTSIIVPEGVTEIGDHAFSYCSALASVKLPQSLTKIGECALFNCGLANVVLPNGLESIGGGAFEGCCLSSISIPDSVTRVHARAFGNFRQSSRGLCEPASDVGNGNDVFDADSIPGLLLVDGWVVGLDSSRGMEYEYDDPTEYLNQALQDARIRGIACRAFENCSWLRYLVLPSCVKYVGGSLLANCSRLEWVDIPDGVEEIEASAFYYCGNLSGVSISDSVRSVGQNAFQGCSFIDSESIPGLEIVDGWILKDNGLSERLSQDDAFTGELVISGVDGIRGIAYGAFAGEGHGDDLAYSCCGSCYLPEPGLRGVKSLIVGDGVTGIGAQAFAVCDDLTNVYVSASVKYIGEKAFYDCRSLHSVYLPDTLEGKMSDSVFAKCPESLKIIYYEVPRPLHEVCFDPNYDEGEYVWREVEEGRAIGELPEISRDQYRFLGWFTASDGGEKVSATTFMGEYDVTYWAHWKAMSAIDWYGPFIIGDNAGFNVELVGYTAKGLPSGFKYDAKKGVVSGTAKKAGEYEVTFTKKGEDDVKIMISVREEEVSVGCAGLSGGTFTAGVAGSAEGIPLEIESETGVKSVSVTKLPAGMKYDAKAERITGAPTKAGDYNVVVTVMTKSGAKRTETIAISVAALPDNVVGTFNGFVKAADGEENAGTFQLTTTDAGKPTAKVVMAAGTYSFSGTCWDKVDDGIYSVTLATKKGETLTFALDSTAGWDVNQLTGSFTAGTRDACPYQIVARRNAFGKTWYFAAEGGVASGWTLSYAANAKAANLTVTLNADGSTKIAGKLGTLNANGMTETLSVNASGYADVTGIANGAILADFAPVVSVKEGNTTVKRVLSIRANLWFDRSNDHAEGVGSARVVE